jgi:ABC-2 type transport system ATP-binding protein
MTKNLTKYFGSRKVVDDISLETYAGEVFGFLGPNGAGKTTTIKMILGLLTRDGGEIFINGIDAKKDFEGAMRNIGGIVENPEMYNYLTGLQNLRQYKRIRDNVTEERIAEVIKLVGLEKRARDKVKKYSLGMKQRLGIAQSIMHYPKVLILDEPTNGLDPAGIKELRDTLKKLAHNEGVGVFVSSHLLWEMQQMCDRVGIIHRGKLIDVRSAEQLTASDNEDIYRFTAEPADKAAEIIAEMAEDGVTVVEKAPNHVDIKVPPGFDVNLVTAKLIAENIALRGINKRERSLEDMFMEITRSGSSSSEGGDQIA